MNKEQWQKMKLFCNKVRALGKKHATRPPVSRSRDYTRLTKADLRGIAEYLDIDINRIRWNAKKKKLFVDGKMIAQGRTAMVEWKKKVTRV